MGKVESHQQQIQELSAEELAELRDWFLELDWQRWDTQLEQDVRAGRLADLALRDQATGRSTPI